MNYIEWLNTQISKYEALSTKINLNDYQRDTYEAELAAFEEAKAKYEEMN